MNMNGFAVVVVVAFDGIENGGSQRAMNIWPY